MLSTFVCFLTRELRKQVLVCSGGSDCANERLVDYLIAFRNSTVLRAHISFEISSVALNMELLVQLTQFEGPYYSFAGS